jgi:hypothetical protein
MCVHMHYGWRTECIPCPWSPASVTCHFPRNRMSQTLNFSGVCTCPRMALTGQDFCSDVMEGRSSGMSWSSWVHSVLFSHALGYSLTKCSSSTTERPTSSLLSSNGSLRPSWHTDSDGLSSCCRVDGSDIAVSHAAPLSPPLSIRKRRTLGK